MRKHNENAKMIRFLTISFVALALFSVAVFTLLNLYMGRRSDETISKVGTLYMDGIREQISMHFETMIDLRLQQLGVVVKVVSAEGKDGETLREELVYRSSVRDFTHLALCSKDGRFETLYGDTMQVVDLPPFLLSMNRGEEKIAVGVDAAGQALVLLGVRASYPMENGENSVALVAALPVSYIQRTLSLEEESKLLYSYIIRRDGSFVICPDNIEETNYFDYIRKKYSGVDQNVVEEYLVGLGDAMASHENYSAVVKLDGERRQTYCMPLPYSEWNLVSILPYGVLDDAVNSLGEQRVEMILFACGLVLLLILLIFLRYSILTRQQLHELEEARQMAVQATKAKSEFLSNMSHDIRTPMNAIVGMTAIAMAHVDDQEQVRNCLRKIAMSSKHLLGLINDVLDMSKIESGKMTLTLDQVSLREIVEGIVSIVQPQVHVKKQNFDVHIDNIFTENVYCDSVRLNQVLLNLLSNAVKFTPEDGTIQLSLSEDSSPRGERYVRVHIRVKDNGIGMSSEFIERIYESYSRADSARVHKTEGAGLGMAITKYIVDAMEGTIDIQSTLGQGTEFHLTLDLERADIEEVDMVLPPWNMLVVDDDELLCQTAVSALQSIGVHADWTMSGESAIELVIQHQKRGEDYQIILIDWKLPGMDGIQVAREIRRNLGENIPILLISAYDWTEFEAEARAAGINGFIAKPLFKSTLFYGLRQYMEIEETQSSSLENKTDISGRRVLLAEDNDLNWEVANALLSSLGVNLERAENGQVCLEKFSQSPEGYYDAILMDIRMPVMTGHEAAMAIRTLNRPDAGSVPIIAMTADAFSEDIQRCLDCGMNAHIAKPIHIDELVRLLQKYMQ